LSRGFATEGALASLNYGFKELSLARIISITRPEPLASRWAMAKCGLDLRGETRWRGFDVVWYA
jgi:RimJ/RimL family protein N-acetyltransferase